MESLMVGKVFVAALLLSQILASPVSDSKHPSAKSTQAIEDDARNFLEDLEPKYSKACNEEMTVRWEYITNVTDENERASVDALTKYQEFQAAIQRDILDNFPNWRNEITNKSIKREFTYLSTKGPAGMNPDHVREMNTLVAQMESAYASATVCKYDPKNPIQDPEKCAEKLYLEPDLEDKLQTATDYDELAYYWTGW
ncbi:unnamed protein product, partial [Allacma fusca]